MNRDRPKPLSVVATVMAVLRLVLWAGVACLAACALVVERTDRSVERVGVAALLIFVGAFAADRMASVIQSLE